MTAADRRAIDELLDDRASALRERDPAGFESTLGASGDRFRIRQLDLYEAMGDVPFSKYELRARWGRYGDLARPRDADRYGAAEMVAIPLTEERYRLEGDESDVVEDLYLTFVKRDGRWGIESDSDVEEMGFLTARHLWDFGPVDVQRKGRFVVVSRRCADCSRLSDRVLALSEEGYAQALDYWPGPAPGRVVVLVPASEQELERLVQATFDLVDFIAFTVAFVDPTKSHGFTGPRIVLGSSALGDEPAARAREIMAHELLHLMTRPASGPFVPLWVEEGYADYTGKDADYSSLVFLRARIEAGDFDGKLPRDHEFTTGDHDSIYAAYQEAHSAIRFLAERWGAAGVADLYVALGAAKVSAGTTRYHVDRALRESIGIGAAVFERRWTRALAGSIS